MKIHFIGIGGIGVSALAGMLLEKGNEISGSDVSESPITKNLHERGAKIFIGHKKENILPGTELVVHTAAATGDNPELKEAQEKNIKIQTYAQALGDLTRQMYTIAISGMHGKSTTTAMAALMLERAGLDPVVIVGTKLKEWDGQNFRLGKSSSTKLGTGQLLVIEADEYNASFLNYWPKILILTNIEEEHLDFYEGGLSHIMKTFGEYISHLSGEDFLIANEEDENIKILAKGAKCQIKFYNSKKPEGLELKIPGAHNISNSNAVLALAEILNIDKKIVLDSLNQFSGTWRRMEFRGEVNGAKIFDDYGHHPTEINATLQGARQMLGQEGKLWCVFQPHQYQRTYKLFDQFVGAFKNADKAVLLPIYSVAGREKEEIKQKTSSEKLAQAINEKGGSILYLDSFEKAAEYLKNNFKKGDICIIMGAGNINSLTEIVIHR